MLGTEATVKREYTRALIRDFAQGCDVTLVGSAAPRRRSPRHALRAEPVDEAAIAAEIAPCFVDDGARRTDTVVLACTHFPLLLDRLARLAPWPVAWIDPAPAIARRVVDLLGPPQARPQAGPRGRRPVQRCPAPLPGPLASLIGLWNQGHRRRAGDLT